MNLLDVTFLQLFVSHKLFKPFNLGLITLFFGQMSTQMLSCALHGQTAISDIYSEHLESLFSLIVEVFAEVVLDCGLFVDPETDLVREAHVVVSSWKQCMFHRSNIDGFCPLTSFKEALCCNSRRLPLYLSSLFLGLHQHLFDTFFKVRLLNHSGRNIQLHFQTAYIVKTLSLSDHL